MDTQGVRSSHEEVKDVLKISVEREQSPQQSRSKPLRQEPRIHRRRASRKLVSVSVRAEMLKFKSPRGSICFSFTFLWAIESEGSVDCSVRVVLCQKSPSVGRIHRMINRAALKRHRKEERKAGRRDWLNAGLWSSLYTEPLRLQLPLHVQPTQPFLRENTVCQFPWRHTHCVMAALKSILSNDTCSLTFCQIRGLFGRVYLSQQQRPLHSYSQCSGTNGIEESLVNYVWAISFLWMCIVLRVMPGWTHLNRLLWLTLKKRDMNIFFPFMWSVHVHESLHMFRFYQGTNLRIFLKLANIWKLNVIK